MITLTKELKNKQCTYRLGFCGDRKSLKSKSSLCIYRAVEFLICKTTTQTKQTKQQQNTPTPPPPPHQFCSSGVRLCKSLRCSKHHHHKLNICGCQTLFRFYKLRVRLFDRISWVVCKHLCKTLAAFCRLENEKWDKKMRQVGYQHFRDT